jgi:alginate O-acetyltransferase complex protein AlgI
MLFNSLDFAIFLPVVFVLYWFVTRRSLRLQNTFIVAASLLFYGWWDWRFLFLLLFTVSMDFTIGRALTRVEDPLKRKLLVACSLVSNLSILGFFKYFNFFVANFQAAFTFFGHPLSLPSLNIVLPVGISFYTFQSLSYTIDVYRRDLPATRNPIDFLAFVSFFPQLVAGPIERASNLLPQFQRPRTFSRPAAVDGLRQILWGLFKKMVIADNCAEHVNAIFADVSAYPGSLRLLGAVFFAFQIYGDFSGYSDIAIGSARLLGFNLMRNFAYPYFSRDIAEFWRRWHISLSTWFRDYLYVPLGGSRGGTAMKIRNTFAIFLVSGFWHGANWTFIVWGFLNALYFLPLLLRGRNRRHLETVAQGRRLPSLREFFQMATTFALTLVAWVFFRAQNLSQALTYLSGIFSPSLWEFPAFKDMVPETINLMLVGFLVAMEWAGREQPYALARFGLAWKRPFRWAFYAFLIFLIGMFMQTKETPFIYFQF